MWKRQAKVQNPCVHVSHFKRNIFSGENTLISAGTEGLCCFVFHLSALRAQWGCARMSVLASAGDDKGKKVLVIILLNHLCNWAVELMQDNNWWQTKFITCWVCFLRTSAWSERVNWAWIPLDEYNAPPDSQCWSWNMRMISFIKF